MDSHEYCNEREEKALTERDEARENLRVYVSRYHKLAMVHSELERRYELLRHQAKDFIARAPDGQAEAWRNGFATLLDQFDRIDTPDTPLATRKPHGRTPQCPSPSSPC